MKIDRQIQGSRVVLCLTGRLDAAWADHVHGAIQDAIRDGHHQIRIDASGLDYVSSAGIRALLKARRELESVNGSFGIIRAAAFVEDTLRMSGLEAMVLPDDEAGDADAPVVVPGEPRASESGIRIDCHGVNPEGRMAALVHARWTPWREVGPDDIHEVEFPRDRIGLGIGALGRGADPSADRFGEFVAAGGCLAWLPGDGSDRPDYLEQAERFIPRVQAIQALVGEGSFSHLLRFHPEEAGAGLPLGDLFSRVLEATQADSAAVVALAEVEGVVGVSMSRSPGHIGPADRPGDFPDVRDWIAFCGERLHRRAQALLVAFVSRAPSPGLGLHLGPVPSRPGMFAHSHAVILPFRPLPQGVLDLHASIRSAFEDNEPLGLYHLIEDDRPVVGLGQTAFTRGACWCAPLHLSTESLS